MVVRVLVVDDSVVVRRLVSDALAQAPDIEVVGVAANGRLAQAKVAQLRPDAVTMDVEMPEMNGIEAVRALRAAGHRMPIVMFSTLTERGAAATLDALAAGATDYVAKPSNVGSVQESIARVVDELAPRLRALVPAAAMRTGRLPGAPGAAAPARAAVRTRPAPPAKRVRLAVVGSSTGGPEALSRVLSSLTAPPPVPVLVVQHMPPVFTRQLASRLDRLGPATVVEASGEPLRAGTVYVAPGDRHLEVRSTGTGFESFLTDGPPVNYCRPSVDVLFDSAVRAAGGELVATVLTGMGSDGRTGCQSVVDAGGTVIVQDEPTSVVWGMPGAVAQAGLAHQVLPLSEIGAALERSLVTVGVPA